MKTFFATLPPREGYPAATRYGLTVLIVGVTLLLRFSLYEQLREYPFLLFEPAIFLAALLFGVGPGYFATILSTLLAAYFFVPPLNSIAVDPSHILPLLLFVAIGAAISAGTETLRETIDKLAASERHKALLLDEQAHRTKNDLMLVHSVLTMQARSMSDPAGRAALESAISLVGVIAQAQERLSNSKDGGTIEAGAYLEALCTGLGNLLRDVRPITVRVQTGRVELISSQAVCIGLIANELVTNALKYAFPAGRGGVINVNFGRENDKLILRVTDDGIGFAPEETAGFGSRFVRLLTKQLGGQIEYESPGMGTCVTVWLPMGNEAPLYARV